MQLVGFFTVEAEVRRGMLPAALPFEDAVLLWDVAAGALKAALARALEVRWEGAGVGARTAVHAAPMQCRPSWHASTFPTWRSMHAQHSFLHACLMHMEQGNSLKVLHSGSDSVLKYSAMLDPRL